MTVWVEGSEKNPNAFNSGCIQLESELSNAADALYRCTNLRKLSLQGCHFLESRTIQRILKANPNLEHISLVGLMTRVTSSTCNTILNFNRNLRSLDVSSCRTITARSIKRIVANCPELICLAASGIRGFNDVSVANEIHRRNKLESLDLQGCNDFKDNSLKALMIGRDTVVDYFGEFNVEPRRLKVLNLSGCETLSDDSIQMMAGRVPDLEELFLSRNIRISDHSLNQILPTVPNLVTLELEELEGLTENFCTALASSPCAGNLRRLNLSSCINIPAESLSNLVPYLPSLTMLEVDGSEFSLLSFPIALMYGRVLTFSQQTLATVSSNNASTSLERDSTTAHPQTSISVASTVLAYIGKLLMPL